MVTRRLDVAEQPLQTGSVIKTFATDDFHRLGDRADGGAAKSQMLSGFGGY